MRHLKRFLKEWQYHRRMKFSLVNKVICTIKWTWLLRHKDIKNDFEVI